MANKLPIIILLFAFLGSLACSLSTGILSNAPQPTSSPVPTTEPVPPTDPPPTRQPATPTPTLQPTATPTKAAVSPIPTPEVDFDDLTPHRQVMLPEFAADVETVAGSGASRYYIDLTFEPDGFSGNENLTFKGVQRIRYTNSEDVPLSEIYFRLYPNLLGGQIEVETVVIDNRLVKPQLEAANSALRLPLVETLPPGNTADISLIYEVTVPTNAQQGYNIFSYTDKTLALATFYPVIAVYDEQGWNTDIPIPYGDVTYLDTSLYQVRLTVPDEMVVAASGSLLADESNNDGTKTLVLASGPMRDFYLAMREDYQLLSEVVDGTVVNSYFPPGLEDGGQLVLRYAADALHLFNQRFGQYPFAEFDVVATPTTAGGVEYPGIVVVGQQFYHQKGGFFEHATAHEVAHQWWYSLVGNDQVNEPWLDESLTNYSAIIYWEEIEGQASADFVVKDFFIRPYQQAKKQGQDKAVLGPVSNFTQTEYGAFVYGKGALFFDALRQEVGDDLYFEIMKTYYSQYKYQIADSEALFDIIEQVAGRNIEPLLETWLRSE